MTTPSQLIIPHVYLVGAPDLLQPLRLNLPWGHVDTRALYKAHAVFVWLGRDCLSPSTPSTMYLVGLAFGLGKPVFAGAASGEIFDSHSFLHESFKQHVVRPDIRDAYETVMADLDITSPSIFSLNNAAHPGLCYGCGGSYQ